MSTYLRLTFATCVLKPLLRLLFLLLFTVVVIFVLLLSVLLVLHLSLLLMVNEHRGIPYFVGSLHLSILILIFIELTIDNLKY